MYGLNGFANNTVYKVRLPFAEIYWNSVGDRIFDVSINGLLVLNAFDILAQAGGRDRAIVREFQTTSTQTGQIIVNFQTRRDNAKISGIEVLASTGTPTPTPTPTPTQHLRLALARHHHQGRR